MKEEQRKTALARRRALSEEEVKQHSAIICASLMGMLKEVNGVYIPYGNEVDVTSLCIIHDHSFAIPKTFGDHTIRFYEFKESTSLLKSRYGIQEPVDGVEITKLDVLIVPLVAFDEQCHRLGHGGGYYDRYLKGFTGLRIGVAHECQKFDKLCVQSHDEPLDMIVTEDRIYKRNN